MTHPCLEGKSLKKNVSFYAFHEFYMNMILFVEFYIHFIVEFDPAHFRSTAFTGYEMKTI